MIKKRLIFITPLVMLTILIAGAQGSAPTKIPTDIPKWTRFVEVTGSYVNLRMEPSIEGEKLEGEYFAKGEVAPLLDETEDWVKVYYAYSPKQYVWMSKQYAHEAHQELLPDEYRFNTFLTYGDNMLTYKFDGKLTNIVYKSDYPFETVRIRVNEPDLYKNDGRFMSTIDTGVDWATLMPQIIKTIPDCCVYKHLRGIPLQGESYNFRTDHDTEEFSQTFYYVIWVGDVLYELEIHALPTNNPDELFLIAHSQSGIDGFCTDLLTSMRYNYKTGKYSDIQEGLPGVVIDKLGLSYDIYKDTPEYQRAARESTTRHLDIIYFLGIPMVKVTGSELALIYPIDTDSIEGYTEHTTVYFLWDGDKFVKLVRSPYIDKPVDIESCSSYMRYSSRQLSRKILAITGDTLNKYINRVRVEYAKRLMHKDPTLSLLDISIRCGADSQEYFARQFRQYEGLTPTQYLKSLQKLPK